MSRLDRVYLTPTEPCPQTVARFLTDPLPGGMEPCPPPPDPEKNAGPGGTVDTPLDLGPAFNAAYGSGFGLLEPPRWGGGQT